MKRFKYKKTMAIIAVLGIVFLTLDGSASAKAVQAVKYLVNQTKILSKTSPVMMQAQILEPINIIGDKTEADVNKDGVAGTEVPAVSSSSAANEQNASSVKAVNQQVAANTGSVNNTASQPTNVSNPTPPVTPPPTVTPIPSRGEDPQSITIMGTSVATSSQLKALLRSRNSSVSPSLVDLYLSIGARYGIRGDIAFCQAAKETGWWTFGGIVQPRQNNYCGLGATGTPATGSELLRGADPSQVWYEAGVHGCVFLTPAAGVEAHIQHLYAYTGGPVPAHLLDPRFTLVSWRTSTWVGLNGKWAVPGIGYGESIIRDYYMKAFAY